MSDNLLKNEEERIHEAYANRRDGNKYSWFEPGQLYMVQEREKNVLALLKRYRRDSLKDQRILEVGCGTGYWVREFIKWGVTPRNITGVDLLADRIAEVKHLCPSDVQLQCGSAADLDFPDESFDIVLQSTVFTSILDSDMKRKIANEMLRLVKPDGLIIWYDYHVNNPRNSDVRGVNKREIMTLFKGCRVDLRRVTLAPPAARKLGKYSWLACYLLGKIPLLCTHYLGVIQKKG